MPQSVWWLRIQPSVWVWFELRSMGGGGQVGQRISKPGCFIIWEVCSEFGTRCALTWSHSATYSFLNIYLGSLLRPYIAFHISEVIIAKKFKGKALIRCTLDSISPRSVNEKKGGKKINKKKHILVMICIQRMKCAGLAHLPRWTDTKLYLVHCHISPRIIPHPMSWKEMDLLGSRKQNALA